MPMEIVRNDITKMRVDAIVNAANNRLADGGGVTGAIFRAAGPALAREAAAIGGCPTGEARATRGHRLPCKYVIHTPGPVWRGGGHGERELLASCYRRSLELACELGCSSVAFPLISAGIYGYPKDQALRVATDAIRDFLLAREDVELAVYLVVFDRASFQLGSKLYAGIAQFIDDCYADAHTDARRRPEAGFNLPPRLLMAGAPPATPNACAAPGSLEGALSMIDEGFSEMVLRKIDELGMKDADCYKRANLDRKLFSKIRKDARYRPKKQTALALAIALRLSLDETRELLMKAGFALSHSSKADIIVEYFILRGNYDIFEINEALYSFDQVPLGGRA